MIPCSGCRRHVRAEEAHCPFCGTSIRSEDSPLFGQVGMLIAALALVGSVGCSTDKVSAETSTGESSSSETTLDPTGQTSTETGEMSETDEPPDPSGSFYAPATDASGVAECDPWAQDCPEGEKCIAISSIGGDFPDANECVPLVDVLDPGEACDPTGWAAQPDNCGPDSFCYPDGPGADTGTCTAYCTGTPDNPLCDEGTNCVTQFNGSINLCFPDCDPLLQDCVEAGDNCVWHGPDFACVPPLVPVGSEGQACGLFNDCEAGTHCVSADLLVGCEDGACCTSYCDVGPPAEACSDGLQCFDFFEQGRAPLGHEAVGVCLSTEP